MGGERNGPSFGESGTNDRNFPESFMKCMQPSFAVDLPSNGFPTPKRSLPKFVPGVFLSFLAGRQGLCASTLHFYRANLFISQKKDDSRWFWFAKKLQRRSILGWIKLS